MPWRFRLLSPKFMYAWIALAIVAGGVLGYFLSGEGSIVALIFIFVFIVAGTWVLARWLGRKTGVTERWERLEEQDRRRPPN